ncbi:MAG: glycosyltransferase family 1 protein [Candidatus Theseobacter exili]|nr:glycosyltransferase family 1 protein [Candidatus Theseobacter exili]
MKICIDARVPQLGGSRTYTDSLLDAIIKTDAVNEYYILWDSVQGHSRFDNTNEKEIPWKGKLNTLWWSHTTLPKFLKKEKIDVYHSFKQLNLFSSQAARIYTFHTAGPFLYPQFYKWAECLHWKAMFKLSAMRSEAVIVCSEADKKVYAEKAGIPDKKIRVTYLAAQPRFKPITDSTTLDKYRHELNLPDKYMLFVGTLYPFKNVEAVIQGYAISQIYNKTGHKLVIAGKKGWFYEKTFALVKELDIESNVIFLGYQNESLPALYNMADLFVFPSHYESFGLPVLEAMSCGTPVITSTAGALPEVAGKAGILVNPTAYEDLAESINEVLNSEEKQRNMSEKGLQQADSFSWERCAADTIAVYREFS